MSPLRSRLLPALATLFALCTPGALAAQACLGQPSFAVNHLQLAAGVAFDQESTGFGANFVSGSESVFGGIGVGGATFDNIQGTSLLVGGTAGFQVPLTSGGAQICPIVNAQFGFGPSDFDGLGTDFSSRAVSFGIAAGGEMFKSDRVALIPSVSLAFAYNEGRYDSIGGLLTETNSYALAGAALGFVVSDNQHCDYILSQPILTEPE